jgi:hypothetical protein
VTGHPRALPRESVSGARWTDAALVGAKHTNQGLPHTSLEGANDHDQQHATAQWPRLRWRQDRATHLIPTSYPTWCEVDTHQEILNDLLHGPADPADLGARAVGEPVNLKDQAGKHQAPAGSHRNPERRADHGEMIHAWGGGQMLTLRQIPTPKDSTGAGGWPFVPLTTRDDLTRHGRPLNLVGEARVMASVLVAATQGVRLRGGGR